MECPHPVTRDGGERMVFRVIFHSPVQERGDGIDAHAAAAESEIIDFRLAARVHGVVDKGVVPSAAVERVQGDDDYEESVVCGDGGHGEGGRLTTRRRNMCDSGSLSRVFFPLNEARDHA